MSPDIHHEAERKESPSPQKLEQAATVANKHPKEVAAELRADPQSQSVLSGLWKWVKDGASSSWHGTKAVFEGTGELIGVGAAKLVHEWGDSFLQYAEEKLKPVGDMVNIAGEAIAITAAEAVHSDHSVIAWAVEYWKEKGVAFGKLPAAKQAELLSSFATQVTLGIVGSKWLSAASKTATLWKTVSLAESSTSSVAKTMGKAAEKTVSGTAKIGVEAAGLDSGAIKPDARWAEKASVRSAREKRAEARSGISPETVRKNAALGDTERLAEARNILTEKWLLAPGASLSPLQEAEILASHRAGKWVYENSITDLRGKIRSGKEAAKRAEAEAGTGEKLTKQERRALMESGIMGADDSAVLSRAKVPSAKDLAEEAIAKAKSSGYSTEEMKSIIKGGDLQKQSDFLKHATPEEIGNALNHGLFDHFADDFSAEFMRTVDEISGIYGKNKMNIGAHAEEIQRIIKNESKHMSGDEIKILDEMSRKMTGPWLGKDFREGFKSVTGSTELPKLIKDLPPSVVQSEGYTLLENAVKRFAVSPESQKDCAAAITAFVRKFPDSAKDSALLMLEHTDPDIWKQSTLFDATNLGFSVNGKEFEPLLRRMAKNTPEKFEKLAKEGHSWNFQLQGLEPAIGRVRPFDSKKFQEAFGIGPSREEAWKMLGKDVRDITESDLDKLTDYHRLKSLLAEHPDTKFLDIATISWRVGKENLDRFFFFSIPRLNAIAQNNAWLQGQIDRILRLYQRDISGHSIAAPSNATMAQKI